MQFQHAFFERWLNASWPDWETYLLDGADQSTQLRISRRLGIGVEHPLVRLFSWRGGRSPHVPRWAGPHLMGGLTIQTEQATIADTLWVREHAHLDDRAAVVLSTPTDAHLVTWPNGNTALFSVHEGLHGPIAVGPPLFHLLHTLPPKEHLDGWPGFRWLDDEAERWTFERAPGG